jgi:hypothetical protein
MGGTPCRQGLNRASWIVRKGKGLELLVKFVLPVFRKMRYWCEWKRGFERVEEADDLSYCEMEYRNWRQIMSDDPSASLMEKGVALVTVRVSN